ncbi:MAG: hypothetical protein SNG02_02165 [Rikenellaceae bacterium]
MKQIIIFIVESTAISALLYALYIAFFRGKASYVAQRILLLSIPIVTTLSALVSFDIVELRGVVGGAMVDVAEVIAPDEVANMSRR